MTGRNQTCPCKSGLKYKRCCLIKDQKKNRLPSPKKELKFDDINRIPASEARAKHAKAVTDRMYDIGKHLDIPLYKPIYKPKESLWRRILKRIKK